MELLHGLGDVQVSFYLPLYQFLDVNSKGSGFEQRFTLFSTKLAAPVSLCESLKLSL